MHVIEVPIGAAAAPALQTALDALPGVATLIVMGTCGALDDALRAGALVVYASCTGAGGELAECDAELAATTAAHLGATLVRGTTVAAIAQTAAAKRRIRAATGAGAVDMESAPMLALARARGLRCTAVRAVSDTSAADLPDLQSAVDADGNLAPGRLALAMLRAPRASFRLALSGPRALAALRRAGALLAAP